MRSTDNVIDDGGTVLITPGDGGSAGASNESVVRSTETV